jgi:hypothetical protein
MSGEIAKSDRQTPFVMHGMPGADRSFKPTSERSGQGTLTRQSARDSSVNAPRRRRQIANIFRCFFPIGLTALSALLFSTVASSAREDYANGFPSDPSFFPIGVWLQSPERAPAYKAIGINTFVGLWKGPTEGQLAALTKYDVFVVASQNDIGLHSANRRIIKGWLLDDEPDNAQPIGMGLYGSCVPATEVVRRTEEMKARDDTRPGMLNFGQGIVNQFWQGRGPCTGDENYYSVAARDVDILSFDIYPVGSRTPQVKGKLEYVARGVTRLMNLAVEGQRVWAFIETTALDPGHPVTPAQLCAEVWMAIIHGARGIVYFVHEFSPTLREDAIFRYPEVVDKVAEENALIKSLANVLNSSNLDGAITVQSRVPIATMVKRYQNTFYVFAVAMTDSASRCRFTLQGFNGAKALVVGEKRDATITRGVFEDSFDGYGVHIYEIPVPGADN